MDDDLWLVGRVGLFIIVIAGFVLASGAIGEEAFGSNGERVGIGVALMSSPFIWLRMKDMLEGGAL